MKIRTQLLLACFFLSVLPLTGIVLYSYRSSRQALEAAYHAEATRLTAQMDRRLAALRSDLDQRLAGLSAIPLGGFNTANGKQDPARSGAVDNILMAMGEAAPLVDSLEFVPVPAQPAPPAPPAPPQVVPAKTPQPSVAADDEANPDGEEQADRKVETTVEVDNEPSEPVVIDLPPVKYPKFVLPPDFNQRVGDITRLSVELGKQSLTPEQREAVKAEMKRKQDELSEQMKSAREKFHSDMQAVNTLREQRQQLIIQRREAARAARDAERERRDAEKAQPAAPPAPPVPVATSAPAVAVPAIAAPTPVAAPQPLTRIVTVRSLSPQQRQMLRTQQKNGALLLGQRLNVPVHNDGKLVGQLRAQLSTDEVIKRVFGAANEESGEIPFAVDREGNVYTRSPTDRSTLVNLGIIDAFRQKKPIPSLPNWVIAMSWDKESGLRIGVARPVGEDLEELRHTAARNFGWGIGVIALALIGILPVADHFTRDVAVVTRGAERIAQGDLMTRLPVHSNNEFGQLATAFNRMAEDLSLQQEKLVEQERARREQDIQQRVLSLEYERKSVELEDARRFQLSMLPKQLPQDERYDIAVLTQTAAEVGGDYYDFHVTDDGTLSVTIGDATGHGAKAGTMVTIVKTLFAGYNGAEPATFLSEAAEKIKRMDLGRMAMALAVARFEVNKLTIASAGMPPVLIHRAVNNRVDEIALGATPLGTLGVDYEQTHAAIARGDTVLLMSDGFPELQSADGQQLGYTRAIEEFASAARAAKADDVIAHLRDAAAKWHGQQPPNDDITFVVVRFRA